MFVRSGTERAVAGIHGKAMASPLPACSIVEPSSCVEDVVGGRQRKRGSIPGEGRRENSKQGTTAESIDAIASHRIQTAHDQQQCHVQPAWIRQEDGVRLDGPRTGKARPTFWSWRRQPCRTNIFSATTPSLDTPTPSPPALFFSLVDG